MTGMIHYSKACWRTGHCGKKNCCSLAIKVFLDAISVEVASFELHHFSDASEYGYGTVSYLRKQSGDGTVQSTFIMAKGRYAPLQYVSVPRLEFQAATIAALVHRLISCEILGYIALCKE